jgi:hypothetical protein
MIPIQSAQITGLTRLRKTYFTVYERNGLNIKIKTEISEQHLTTQRNGTGTITTTNSELQKRRNYRGQQSKAKMGSKVRTGLKT